MKCGMLLDQMFHAPDNLFTMSTFAGYTRIGKYAFVFLAGYILTCLCMCLPGKMKQSKRLCVKPFAIVRLLINAEFAIIPVCLYFISEFM